VWCIIRILNYKEIRGISLSMESLYSAEVFRLPRRAEARFAMTFFLLSTVDYILPTPMCGAQLEY
jgi:hypothetical protein